MNARRQFLKSSSMALSAMGASFFFPIELLSQVRRKVSANDKIQIGLIGCRGMGFTDLLSFLKKSEVELVAICDVDENVLREKTAALVKGGIKAPKWYADYRKLLEDKDIDIAIIGTPDHWHCLQLCDALDAGKDVYCEKPIANSIQECDLMLAKVNASNRMVQVGQWQRSQPHFVDAISYVHSGKLGQIRLVKTWAYQGWMGSIPKVADSEAPVGVDYNMWLGPAPSRPFNSNRFHFSFRWFWDYAGGLMTDWGVHLIDYALYGMKASTPKSVMAIGGKYAYPEDAQETPDTLQTVYEFDGFSLLWEHATGIDNGNYGKDHGIAFIGNNGTLVLNRGGWEVISEKDRQNNDNPKIDPVPLQNSPENALDLHTQNFLEAVKSRDKGILHAPIKVGYDAAKVCHLGNVAFKHGQRIYWNSETDLISDSGANHYLETEYHNGWQLPKN